MTSVEQVVEKLIGNSKVSLGTSASKLVHSKISKALADYQTAIETLVSLDLTHSVHYSDAVVDCSRLVSLLDPETKELLPDSPLYIAARERVLLNSLDDLI